MAQRSEGSAATAVVAVAPATPSRTVALARDRVALVALAIAAAALAAHLAAHPAAFQWDFRVYAAAARAHALGLDPYDTAALARAAGAPVTLPFVYPPVALVVLGPLARVPPELAWYAWLALKLAALALLVRAWHAWLPRALRGAPFLAFCLLAYNATLWADLATGNVTVFEQLALWTGLLAFARGRLVAFCVCVWLASLCKLTPLVFLGLLAFAHRPRRAAALAGATVLAAAAPHALALAVAPSLELGWVRQLSFAGGRGVSGEMNPSLLGLMDTLRAAASRALGRPVPSPLAPLAFALVAAAAAALAFARLRAARFADPRERSLHLIALAALLYAVATPRAAAYSYVIALAPSYLVLRSTTRAALGPALLFALAGFAALDHPTLALPVVRTASRMALAYLPVVLAATFFWLELDLLAARAGAPVRHRPRGVRVSRPSMLRLRRR